LVPRFAAVNKGGCVVRLNSAVPVSQCGPQQNLALVKLLETVPGPSGTARF
jgi:hypothetical protein